MNTDGQKQFIHKVRTALGHPRCEKRSQSDFNKKFHPRRHVSDRLLEKIENRTDKDRRELLNHLIKAAAPLNLNVIPQKNTEMVTAAIAGLVREKEPEWGTLKNVIAWDHPLIRKLNLAEALAEQNVLVETGSWKLETRNSACIGITSADYCMAETATLVMKTRPGQARSVSLLPSVHVAVTELRQIIADMKELYALLKWHPDEKAEGLTNCMTFITGPSKTADIEATLVHGVHGPREVYIYVITG
ncbi:LutC/YkgG family protein [Desulfonema magnum]|uniref:Lactate utilization protein LUD domain-containing n=1 Tax=Desulfonema magnum TaxID=45655 RepID=A0A975GNW3_9BACT|nr:LUD domain-containing protein [Desulfonema magnum]QTA88200.1 Lactate utilization protein LUD domain-containing [Desulfonema magnum]